MSTLDRDMFDGHLLIRHNTGQTAESTWPFIIGNIREGEVYAYVSGMHGGLSVLVPLCAMHVMMKGCLQLSMRWCTPLGGSSEAGFQEMLAAGKSACEVWPVQGILFLAWRTVLYCSTVPSV